jgi:hypothetical protein
MVVLDELNIIDTSNCCGFDDAGFRAIKQIFVQIVATSIVKSIPAKVIYFDKLSLNFYFESSSI